MITCNLREKRFSVDFISGRALREIEPALRMYTRIAKATGEAISGEVPQDDTPIADALDVLVKWFCMLFSNQFTPDEVYDGYPADRLIHDIVLALLAVQAQTTEVLETFPTKAAQESPKTS